MPKLPGSFEELDLLVKTKEQETEEQLVKLINQEWPDLYNKCRYRASQGHRDTKFKVVCHDLNLFADLLTELLPTGMICRTLKADLDESENMILIWDEAQDDIPF